MNDVNTKPLNECYAEILSDYLEHGNETALASGYEAARRALLDGCGVIELAVIHHEALRRLNAKQQLTNELLEKAGDFFSECLSPFEMSHRGAQEGTRALRHLNEVLEAELKRIAHALHDEAGQLLASVHIAIAEVVENLPPHTRDRFDGIERLLRQIEFELRGLSHELRPTVLDNLGLLPALEFLAEKVAKRTGISVSVEGKTQQRLPPAVETALYRIVQEALNNVAKHARAASVKIRLASAAQKVTCTVQDDGIGFVPQGEPGSEGLGLMGIRERLSALEGTLRVDTKPGHGTVIVAEIPLKGG
ncbi:MAG: ATP-binding protein [Gammaproteobacteria bacterium]|nr:ATP-binding protein [Gammaproteobacteria bacterium]